MLKKIYEGDTMFNENSTPLNHKKLLSLGTNNKDPVLIVGMHNSGTSILSEILHNSGIFLGNNMSHYESHFFSIFINDSIIMKGQDNWAKLPIMSINEMMLYKETVGPFIKKNWIIDYVQWGYDCVSKWGIKDPRLCVLLPLYLEVFPQAKVVHILRDPNDVAASLCQKRKKGVGLLDNFDHWKKLSLQYTERVISCSDKASEFYELQYEDFCNESISVTKKLFEFLEIPFTENTKKLLNKVHPSRIGSYHRYSKQKNMNLLKHINNLLNRINMKLIRTI